MYQVTFHHALNKDTEKVTDATHKYSNILKVDQFSDKEQKMWPKHLKSYKTY